VSSFGNRFSSDKTSMFRVKTLIVMPLFMALIFLNIGNVYAVDKANIETGRKIYLFGKTAAGTAKIEGAGGEAPAELFACANCHGERGEGKKETGIVAPAITWQQLQRAYRRDLDGGRKREPYDFESFKALVTQGKKAIQGTSAGLNSLSSVMPRYHLTDTEVESLKLFLQQVDDQAPDGVTDKAIRIGIRLPTNPELAAVILHTLQVYRDKMNTTHGIYRRALEFVDLSNQSQGQDVFCVLDLSLEYRSEISANKIELSVFSSVTENDLHYALYQHPLAYAEVAADVVQRSGWTLLSTKQIQDKTPVSKRVILLHTLDQGSLVEVLAGLKRDGMNNNLLTLSSVNNRLPEEYQNKVFTLQPPGPESVSETGKRAVFDYINQDQGANTQHLPQRLWTLSLLELLNASLSAVGKDITQQRLEQALQSHIDLDTIFGPKLSFSGSRRVGNVGAVLKRH